MITMLAVACYLSGAVVTLVWNLSLIVGPVTYPLSVARNAIFWPVFVPVLLALRDR